MTSINLDELTLGQIREISGLCKNEKSKNIYSDFIGKYVIARTYSAGVHVGFLEEIDETKAILKDSQRIWKWEGAFTLSEIAKYGLSCNSKISESVEKILLTQAIEIIPCTKICIDSIKKTGVYKP